MADGTTTLRLRRIRFKSGGTVEILRPRQDDTIRNEFVGSTENCLGGALAGEMVGFAIVAWSSVGQVFVSFENGSHSPIPAGAVANYVRDVLVAEQAVRWSRD